MDDTGKVVEIVAVELEIEQSEFSEESNLEEIGVDSPSLLEIALAIEEVYQISIEDKALAGFKSVKDIVVYVRSHKNDE